MIHSWDREIAADGLPPAVLETIAHDFPGATLREIMAVTAVIRETEVLEGYEIVLVTADQKEIEVTIAPDGRILER